MKNFPFALLMIVGVIFLAKGMYLKYSISSKNSRWGFDPKDSIYYLDSIVLPCLGVTLIFISIILSVVL